MQNDQLEDTVPPPNQNNVAVCNQINLLIPYYIRYRLVTLLKIIDASIKSLIFFILLLVSSSSILAFRYSFFLFLKCPLASSGCYIFENGCDSDGVILYTQLMLYVLPRLSNATHFNHFRSFITLKPSLQNLNNQTILHHTNMKLVLCRSNPITSPVWPRGCVQL